MAEFGCAAKPASPTLAGAERIVDSDQSDTELEKDGQQKPAFQPKNKYLLTRRASTPPKRDNRVHDADASSRSMTANAARALPSKVVGELSESLDCPMITKPIYTGEVNGRPLRFFKSPRPELGPQFPWHSWDDLAHCLDLPRGLRRHLRHAVASKNNPGGSQSIAPEEGILLIASHSTAQGFIGAAIEAKMPGNRDDDIEMQYVKALFAANKAIGDLRSFDEMIQAYHNG